VHSGTIIAITVKLWGPIINAKPNTVRATRTSMALAKYLKIILMV
jgi:hypothetical protein